MISTNFQVGNCEPTLKSTKFEIYFLMHFERLVSYVTTCTKLELKSATASL